MESDMNEKTKNGNSIAAGFFLLLLLTVADQLTKVSGRIHAEGNFRDLLDSACV